MIEYLFEKIEETINYSYIEQETYMYAQVINLSCILVYKTGFSYTIEKNNIGRQQHQKHGQI